jgi:hypothetical protein
MNWMTSVIKRKIFMVSAVFGIMFLAILIDYYVGIHQEGIIQEKKARIRDLETKAFYMLSADIRDIRPTRDIEMTEEYEVWLRTDNVSDEAIYISPPVVKAFVQTGSISWTEVPVKDDENKEEEQVHKIEPEDQSLFKKYVRISRDLPYNEYLIRKYMHVHFYIFMYVVPESGFKEGEVVERRSSSYVYLKPYYLSDQEIRKVIDFGETKVPFYMPITAFRNWNETKINR